MTMIELRDVSLSYAGSARPAVDHVDLAVSDGEFCALLGPNGSGKSSLIKLMLGAIAPTTGTAFFKGSELSSWDRQSLARHIGVVPQLEEMVFPMTVREFVAMGRYPHLGPWRREGAHDRAAIESAMLRCDIESLGPRIVGTLSGGERQRVRIARALAQEPGLLVLDEPTAALDLAHEMAVFELLAQLREQSEVTVIAATHNINLAARYASRAVLLDRGRVIEDGPAASIMRPELVGDVYRWPVAVYPHPGAGTDKGVPQVATLKNGPSLTC